MIMSDPYRTSPEVIERIVEVPVDRVVEKIVYKDRVVEKIPKCEFARCPSCEETLKKIGERHKFARQNQGAMLNAGHVNNAASFAREAELLIKTYTELSLRKCQH